VPDTAFQSARPEHADDIRNANGFSTANQAFIQRHNRWQVAQTISPQRGLNKQATAVRAIYEQN